MLRCKIFAIVLLINLHHEILDLNVVTVRKEFQEIPNYRCDKLYPGFLTD